MRREAIQLKTKMGTIIKYAEIVIQNTNEAPEGSMEFDVTTDQPQCPNAGDQQSVTSYDLIF